MLVFVLRKFSVDHFPIFYFPKIDYVIVSLVSLNRFVQLGNIFTPDFYALVLALTPQFNVVTGFQFYRRSRWSCQNIFFL